MSTPGSESYRDSLYNVDLSGRRVGFFPKRPRGKHYKRRSIVALILIIILFVTPWIKIGGEQIFLFNFLERKFVLFGRVFFPQDFHLLVITVLTFFISVVLFTVVYGRIWCGWACPQTIFLEMVYRRIEFWIDGDSIAQRKLKKAPWTGKKVFKRVLKHSIFLLIAFAVANTVLAYIVGSDRLVDFMRHSPFDQPIFFAAVVANSAAFYFVFSWFREQACTMVCPYGRLQECCWMTTLL